MTWSTFPGVLKLSVLNRRHAVNMQCRCSYVGFECGVVRKNKDSASLVQRKP